MAIRAKGQSPWFLLLILAAGAVLWILDQRKTGPDSPAPPPPAADAGRTPPHAAKQGGYEIHRNCTLAFDRGNDGDSFKVRFPDGRQEIMRLYFVDTPESAFRSYRNGETNHQRIAEQAAYFGASPDRAVEIGARGKEFTLDLLAGGPSRFSPPGTAPSTTAATMHSYRCR